MRQRYKVLTLLFVLSMITFLDRVCLSVAGPRMQRDLHISPKRGAGWWECLRSRTVFSKFLSVFLVIVGSTENPGSHRLLVVSIHLSDGSVTSVALLLVVRFLFGAGEGGGLPE